MDVGLYGYDIQFPAKGMDMCLAMTCGITYLLQGCCSPASAVRQYRTGATVVTYVAVEAGQHTTTFTFHSWRQCVVVSLNLHSSVIDELVVPFATNNGLHFFFYIDIIYFSSQGLWRAGNNPNLHTPTCNVRGLTWSIVKYRTRWLGQYIFQMWWWSHSKR